MGKTIGVYDSFEGKLNDYFFSDLEKELGEGEKCFNCEFCGDVVTEKGIVKDAVIDCLGSQAGIQKMKLGEVCHTHKYIDNYSELRK